MHSLTEIHKRGIIDYTISYLQHNKLNDEIRFLSLCRDIEIVVLDDDDLKDVAWNSVNHLQLTIHPICTYEIYSTLFDQNEGAPTIFHYGIEEAFRIGTENFLESRSIIFPSAVRQDFGISIDYNDRSTFPDVRLTLWPELDWKDRLQGVLEKRNTVTLNQGVKIKDGQILEWNRLNFRSHDETLIAGALDRANVLFLPNCAARLGSAMYRTKLEADFIVCHNGKWGILEVSGKKHHTPQTRPDEASRERLFKAHGVRVVESYTAEECRKDPDGVVESFLRLLAQNG